MGKVQTNEREIGRKEWIFYDLHPTSLWVSRAFLYVWKGAAQISIVPLALYISNILMECINLLFCSFSPFVSFSGWIFPHIPSWQRRSAFMVDLCLDLLEHLVCAALLSPSGSATQSTSWHTVRTSFESSCLCLLFAWKWGTKFEASCLLFPFIKISSAAYSMVGVEGFRTFYKYKTWELRKQNSEWRSFPDSLVLSQRKKLVRVKDRF